VDEQLGDVLDHQARRARRGPSCALVRQGTVWAISFYDYTVNNTMLFLNGAASLDMVYTPSDNEIPFHIQVGAIRDVPRCPDDYPFPTVPDVECTAGESHTFALVAERVYDLPF
jgi:hypothetical protein